MFIRLRQCVTIMMINYTPEMLKYKEIIDDPTTSLQEKEDAWKKLADLMQKEWDKAPYFVDDVSGVNT